jgi:hypothetical protein
LQNVVGYESLADALRGLVSDPKTADETLGLVLSLAIHNFEAKDIFTRLRSAPEDELELVITEYEPRLGTIRRPGAMLILWNMIPGLTADNSSMRYAIFKLVELLSHVSHRNQAILSSLGLVRSLFDRFYDSRNDTTVSERERHMLQKLLRRLLDMGATTSEARLIFQKAIKEDDTLDTEVLDVIRFGMKSRWLEHISLESPAALVLHEDGMKGMPVTGFTFMVCNSCIGCPCLLIPYRLKLWVWISEMPPNTPHPIFTAKLPSRTLLTLSIHPDGKIELSTAANPESTVFTKSKLHKFRWTHITLVHHPHKASNPSIRKIPGSIPLILSLI